MGRWWRPANPARSHIATRDSAFSPQSSAIDRLETPGHGGRDGMARPRLTFDAAAGNVLGDAGRAQCTIFGATD